jgi:hypothetical protein
MNERVTPDPRPPRRIIDLSAMRRARIAGDECCSCGRPPSNVHHVIERGAPHHGDDTAANLVLVCGSGTTGCHGALHGSPYVDGAGVRWTSEVVRGRIGRHLALRRPDTIEYVLGKLGSSPGRVFLRRHYHLDVPDLSLPGGAA